ncbi:lipopolysaccharide-induced tumor necrosis factor-alpha factor homolog [Drosophila mauritiana]|uniref:Lipopolysaccharide-induced tumor necrosis factor-alpha factor homolog n=1 Tax=Drosophila mauritiana TaxID=7226 RepID=A0A6P8KSB7_DROMA|nr:lipopolysaccharide-induced tumor necrosis factor-alpha factor homolog [Drosophila mauritiana]
MAEEKHRMLFQDQDPGQDLQKQRPMSLSPSEPPTYDNAMQKSAIQESLNYSTDRRRTVFAEPQHLRSRVEEMPLHQMEDEVSVQSERLAMPPVRNFFILSPQPKLGNQAMDIVCPACGQRGVTRLKRSPNARTNLWAIYLCTFGWCCCACLFPYLWNGCRTTNHYCSVCEIFLGAHYPRSCCCRRL